MTNRSLRYYGNIIRGGGRPLPENSLRGKYRNNAHIPVTDTIVELCKDEQSKVTSAFLVTKQLDDFGISKHETATSIMRVPALVFLYQNFD